MIYQNSKGETIESDYMPDMALLPILAPKQAADAIYAMVFVYESNKKNLELLDAELKLREASND